MQVSLIPEYGDTEYICVFRGLYNLGGLSKSRGVKVTYGSNFTYLGELLWNWNLLMSATISEVLYEHSTHFKHNLTVNKWFNYIGVVH